VVDDFTVCVCVLGAGAPVANAAGVVTLFVGAADSLAAAFVVSSSGHLFLCFFVGWARHGYRPKMYKRRGRAKETGEDGSAARGIRGGDWAGC